MLIRQQTLPLSLFTDAVKELLNDVGFQ